MFLLPLLVSWVTGGILGWVYCRTATWKLLLILWVGLLPVLMAIAFVTGTVLARQQVTVRTYETVKSLLMMSGFCLYQVLLVYSIVGILRKRKLGV